MNIKKIKQANNYIYDHCDRTDDKALHTTSNIDPTRSYLNFNVSENNRHRREQLLYIREQTHKPVRSNAVSCFALVITLPKNYLFMINDDQKIREFFTDAYACIRDFFDLRDSDVASSWVHMDETTPHMHFLGTPLYRKDGETVLFYDKVVPREKYKTYHVEIERRMKEKGWHNIELLNGATRDGNLTVQQLKARSLRQKNKELEDALKTAQEALLLSRQQQGKVNTDIENLNRLKKQVKEETKDLIFASFCSRYAPEILPILREAKDDHRLSIPAARDLNVLLLDKEKESGKKEEKQDENKIDKHMDISFSDEESISEKEDKETD